MSLPPGPPLPAAVQTLLYLLRPIDFLTGCQRRYGDCFSIDTIVFGPEVVVASPELVKQVFSGDPDELHAGEANVVLEPLLGRRSVLLLDGAEHLRQRRLMMPPFHGERMLAYARTMRSIAEQVVAGWPVGRPFALHPHMQRVTLDIILRTVFGVGADERARLDALRDALTTILDGQASTIGALAGAPVFRRSFFGLSPWDAFQRALRRADELIHAQIAQRRADAAPRDDVLSMLLAARDEEGRPMTDAELRDELMTLLAAGHETTATMLCWAFELILGDPQVEARLRAEIAGADAAAIGRLPYLDAVVKELLRLRPVIPAVGRVLTAPMTLAGHRLPARTLVVPAVYLVHHRADVYPEPEAFRPERFLDNKPDPYAWLPFGGGVRRCLGMAFAIYELKVVIAAVLERVRMRRVRREPARVVLRGFTFAPEGGAEVVVASRLASRAEHDTRAREPPGAAGPRASGSGP
jgi:cytochrome P450